MVKKLNVLVFLFVVFAVAGVRAQEEAVAASSKPKENKPIMFSVDLRGEYTDNRDAVKTGKESTFDIYVQPRIDLNFDWSESATVLIFSYAPSYRYRSNPSDLQNKSQLFHDLSLDLRHKPSKNTELVLKDTFTMADDPSVQQNGATVRGDTSYSVNNAEVGVNNRFDRLTELDVKGDHELKKYKEKQYSQTSDESNYGGAITLLRQIQRTVAFVGIVNYKDYSYEKVQGVERGFSLIGGSLGLDDAFSKESVAGFRVGYQSANYKDSKLSDKGSPCGDLYLKYAPIPTFRLGADAAYTIMDSGVYPYSSQKATTIQLTGEWDADSMITLGADVAYAMGKYETDTVDPTLSATGSGRISGDQNTVLATVSVTYRVSNDVSVKLAQTLDNMTSDVRDGYTKNTTALSANVKF